MKEDHTLENISFDMKQVLEGKNDILLRMEDQVAIHSIFGLRMTRKINID